MDQQNYSVARVKCHTRSDVGKFERHIERKNETYSNMNIISEQTQYNVCYKRCDTTYNEKLKEMVENKQISLRGLKENAKVYNEMVVMNLQKIFMRKHFTLLKKKWDKIIYCRQLCMLMN